MYGRGDPLSFVVDAAAVVRGELLVFPSSCCKSGCLGKNWVQQCPHHPALALLGRAMRAVPTDGYRLLAQEEELRGKATVFDPLPEVLIDCFSPGVRIPVRRLQSSLQRPGKELNLFKSLLWIGFIIPPVFSFLFCYPGA